MFNNLFQQRCDYIKLWRFNQYIFVLSFSILLNACITISPHRTIAWPLRQKQLQNLQYWHIRGTFLIQTPQKNIHASYAWSQAGQHYTISLFGPLGLGAIKITGQPHHVSLQTQKHETITAPSPEQLLQKTVGWLWPISNLNAWMKGIPLHQKQALCVFDQTNHLTHLEQQHWKIDFKHYKTYGQYDLPGDLTLTNETTKSRIHIVVHDWH